jgi:hypothetical protein
VPAVTLDPELALTLFVAPVLLDAAFDASPLRADGTIGDDAFHKVEEELDRAELSAEAMHPED